MTFCTFCAQRYKICEKNQRVTINFCTFAPMKTLVIHPDRLKERGEHVDRMLRHIGLDYEIVNEGNDVASNLKWVMSSNSIAVTPKLRRETWFMEGTLIPDYHFVEVRDDFSDLEERMTYYIEHPEEAEAIIRHAHEYVEQFFDHEREKLISLLVLKKYFEVTNGHYQ